MGIKMTITTTQIGGRMLLALEYAQDPKAIEYAKERLAKEVAYEGEKWGYFIHEESVWYQEKDGPKGTSTIEISVRWCPDPMQGCEFIGGEYDGDVLKMSRETWGGPPRYLVRYTQIRPEIWGLQKDSPPDVTDRIMRHPQYRLVGINYETDRWAYEFDRMM